MTAPDASAYALLETVREIERYAAADGWDRGPRLFALVQTSELAAHEPGLADRLADASSLTPVEQDGLPPDRDLEGVLATIGWPEQVVGCAVVVERLVLPPRAESQLPTDETEPEALAVAAAGHQDRQDVRLVAAVLRNGTRECAVRLRGHDDEADVLTGPDLVPALTGALLATLS